MELKTFSYSIFRFVPDPVRGESINLGVIVVSDEEGASRCEFLSGFRQKISALAPDANLGLVERAVEDFAQRFDPFYRPTLFGEGDPRIGSTAQLHALAGTMKNQFQLSPPRAYRAAGLDDAVKELFDEFVSPPRRDQRSPRHMALWQLRELIRRTIKDWTGEGIDLKENEAEQVQWASHYAHFWLASGEPRVVLAAVIALPSEPDERNEAWALRDSVPTIETVFRRANPSFKTVVVFPANGHAHTAFAAETEAFLQPLEGVIVTTLDELPALRDKIVPALVSS